MDMNMQLSELIERLQHELDTHGDCGVEIVARRQNQENIQQPVVEIRCASFWGKRELHIMGGE
jgi:hypothetical protein